VHALLQLKSKVC